MGKGFLAHYEPCPCCCGSTAAAWSSCSFISFCISDGSQMRSTNDWAPQDKLFLVGDLNVKLDQFYQLLPDCLHSVNHWLSIIHIAQFSLCQIPLLEWLQLPISLPRKYKPILKWSLCSLWAYIYYLSWLVGRSHWFSSANIIRSKLLLEVYPSLSSFHCIHIPTIYICTQRHTYTCMSM